MKKVLSESEQLNEFISEVVWMAWSAGERAGSSMSSPRSRDRDHADVHSELEKVKKAVIRLLDNR